MKSLYEELGVARTATAPQIKKAYLRRAKETHQDKVGGDAKAFLRVKVAYDTLRHPEARARYDATGETCEQAAKPSQGVELLAQLFTQWLEVGMEGDPIAMMRQKLEAMRETLNMELEQAHRGLAKAAALQGKIQPKGQAEAAGGILEGVLETRKAALRARLEGLRAGMDGAGEALAILRGYAFTGAREGQIDEVMTNLFRHQAERARHGAGGGFAFGGIYGS